MTLLQNPSQYTNMSVTSGNLRLSITDGVSDEFPTGLRVLVVDDDTTCLTVLDLMLQRCLYQVTTCSRALVALNLLRERKGCFDMVLSDVHMPDMDGFTLLDHVGVEMDLPVIMMSADMSTSTVMKGIKHGACDYLIKPVRQEELKNMWQHVVRKKWNESRENELSGVLEDDDKLKQGDEDNIKNNLPANEECGINNLSKKKKNSMEDDIDLESDDPSTARKPRVVWSVQLHQQFVAAVHQLGIDKAVPKKILDLMNVPGLTRENVASHLQKFRIYLRRLNESRIRHTFGGRSEPSIDMYHLPMAMVRSNAQSFLQISELIESELTTTMDQPNPLQPPPPLLKSSPSVHPFIPPSPRSWQSSTIHGAGSTPSGVNGSNLCDELLTAMLQHQVSTATPEKTPILLHTPHLLPPYPNSSVGNLGTSGRDFTFVNPQESSGQRLDGYLLSGASVSPFLSSSSIDKKFPPIFSSNVIESEPFEVCGASSWVSL